MALSRGEGVLDLGVAWEPPTMETGVPSWDVVRDRDLDEDRSGMKRSGSWCRGTIEIRCEEPFEKECFKVWLGAPACPDGGSGNGDVGAAESDGVGDSGRSLRIPVLEKLLWWLERAAGMVFSRS